MDDQGYAKRLQSWVLEQAPPGVRGSLTALHVQFQRVAQDLGEQPVSDVVLGKWRKGLLKGELETKSLRQLAAVRGESIADTQAWLEGNTQTAQKEGCDPSTTDRVFQDKIFVTEKSDLLSLIAQAPIEWMPDILRTLADRVDLVRTPVIATVMQSVTPSYQSPVVDMHTPQFLSRLLRQNGIDPDSDADLIRFIGREDIDLATLKLWLSGEETPSDIDWGEIVLAINTLNGVSIGQEGSITEKSVKQALREFCQNNTNHTQHV